LRAFAAASCLTLAIASAGSANAAPEKPLTAVEPVAVTAKPIPFEDGKPVGNRFGKLQWLGTLELSSQSPYFGGYSGIAVSADGSEFIAVSDIGHWLRGRIVSEAGRLAGVAELRQGPLLDAAGKPLVDKSSSDAEGITSAVPGQIEGDTYISFERKHRIAAVTVGKDGPGPATRLVVTPQELTKASPNEGLEAVTVMRAGADKGLVLAFTERLLDGNGDHVGWMLGEAEPRRLLLKRLDDFDVTDAAALPDGGAVFLERCFPCPILSQMRLRRVSAAEIASTGPMSGETLLLAGQVFEIDNMEGLAVHVDDQGRVILTVISDDNFNRRFQRTLLMRFRIDE
ncbi:MAG: esterase-like activity of phytase family protein, partial [Pseudomonadota bacterium]|nr:esterase-like activity of phytase family protein [Pseudomonadota bacterium]